MIVVCPSCEARYRFDEAKLGDRPRAKTRCAKCGGTIEIENPAAPSASPAEESVPPAPTPTPAPSPAPVPPPEPTPAPAPTAPPETDESLRTVETPVQPSEGQTRTGTETIAGGDAAKMGLLQLPANKRFSLAVIQGSATGQIFQITKTRTVIGRSGSDINLEDPEASRQHAALEIVGDVALIRDLDSTNGTWIDLERIDQQQLSNQQEFRIGTHVLMFIVTEVE
jgi:predicted Zn finger-like uncharacterized protein